MAQPMYFELPGNVKLTIIFQHNLPSRHCTKPISVKLSYSFKKEGPLPGPNILVYCLYDASWLTYYSLSRPSRLYSPAYCTVYCVTLLKIINHDQSLSIPKDWGHQLSCWINLLKFLRRGIARVFPLFALHFWLWVEVVNPCLILDYNSLEKNRQNHLHSGTGDT